MAGTTTAAPAKLVAMFAIVAPLRVSALAPSVGNGPKATSSTPA